MMYGAPYILHTFLIHFSSSREPATSTSTPHPAPPPPLQTFGLLQPLSFLGIAPQLVQSLDLIPDVYIQSSTPHCNSLAEVIPIVHQTIITITTSPLFSSASVCGGPVPQKFPANLETLKSRHLQRRPTFEPPPSIANTHSSASAAVI